MRLIGRIEGVSFYRMNDGNIKVVSIGANWSLKHFLLFIGGLVLTIASCLGVIVGILTMPINWQTALLIIVACVMAFYIANVLFSFGLLGSGNISAIQKWCLRNQDNYGAVMLYQSLKAFKEKEGKE